jgi:diguanylate cyclase (GGDEF)-like protein
VPPSTHILLVEDNRDYASMLQMLLQIDRGGPIQVSVVQHLQQALDLLSAAPAPTGPAFDAILLDLALPDSRGLATFTSLHAHAPSIPIVVLTGLADEALGLQAVHAGAQDYLLKGEVEGRRLGRVLRFAIERQQAVTRLQNLSLVDELTGLLNRRGFLRIAPQHMKLARRSGRGLLLFYADVDGLKRINDEFGHAAGDHALQSVAAALRTAFRSSDVLARLGGDEFTMLAVDTLGDGSAILERLTAALAAANRDEPRFALDLSVGVAPFEPASDARIEDWLARADQALYQAKGRKPDQPGPQG